MKALLVLLFFCQSIAALDIASTWFPSHTGDTWIYQHEERNGAEGGGMAHPEVGRWRVEETIIGSTTIPEGLLLLKRTRPLDTIPAVIARHMPGLKEVRESYYLIHGNCVYGNDSEMTAGNNQLRPKYRDDLLRGNIPPDFCFPLTNGMTWGKVPATSPADELVWHVIGINADPFGPNNETTFHLSAYEGSGTIVDTWFAQGVGVLQEIVEHHGTYEESRLQLLSSVINVRRTATN